MAYWMNANTGRVVERDYDDVPMGDWFEIDEIDYKEALHPLAQSNMRLQADAMPQGESEN